MKTSVIRTAFVLSALCASLILTACNDSEIALSMNGAAAAVEAVVAKAHTDPAITPEALATIDKWADGVSDGLVRSADIIADASITPTEKASAIALAFIGLTQPNLPPGTPQNIAIAVTFAATALDTYLRVVRITAAEIHFTHPELVSGFANHKKLNQLSKAEAKKLRKRAELAKRRIAAARKKG